MLSPAETKDLYPLMNVTDLYGTLYVPKDGTMDPAGTCTTLTRAASARGATVMYTDVLTACCRCVKAASYLLIDLKLCCVKFFCLHLNHILCE